MIFDSFRPKLQNCGLQGHGRLAQQHCRLSDVLFGSLFIQETLFITTATA
jgi:hypothetical protein